MFLFGGGTNERALFDMIVIDFLFNSIYDMCLCEQEKGNHSKQKSSTRSKNGLK